MEDKNEHAPLTPEDAKKFAEELEKLDGFSTDEAIQQLGLEASKKVIDEPKSLKIEDSSELPSFVGDSGPESGDGSSIPGL